MNDDPIPLEQSDPVLAEHLRKIANGVHPFVQTVACGRGRVYINRKPNPGRNDPCPCGSGKKYKKCCGA